MSARELVDQAWDGTREYAHFDADGNLTGLEWKADVEAVIEANRRAQTSGARGYGASRELKHVAAIPPVLLLQWAAEKGVPPAFLNTREGFDEIVLRMI